MARLFPRLSSITLESGDRIVSEVEELGTRHGPNGLLVDFRFTPKAYVITRTAEEVDDVEMDVIRTLAAWFDMELTVEDA